MQLNKINKYKIFHLFFKLQYTLHKRGRLRDIIHKFKFSFKGILETWHGSPNMYSINRVSVCT